MLGTDQMKSSFAGKDLGVMVDNKLTMSQRYALLAKVSSILAALRSVPRRSREVILPHYLAPICHTLWCWAPQYKKDKNLLE